MPPDVFYQLLVIAPDQMPVTFKLLDSAGQTVPPKAGKSPLTWELGGQALHGWVCSLEATKPQNFKVSQVVGLPEIPPSIKMVGRVLPVSLGVPDEQQFQLHLQNRGITCDAAVKLEDNLYLYIDSVTYNVYIADLDGTKSLTVTPPNSPYPNTHRLDPLSNVTVGRVSYVWRTDGLPPGIVGRLDYKEPRDCPSEAMPVLEESPNAWVIARQHNGEAIRYGSVVLRDNPDPYLSRNGNLVISYSGRSNDGRPTFKLTLLSAKQLPLFVWPYRANRWTEVAWPTGPAPTRRFDVQGVELLGVSNKLIFGTGYYNVATSHTL
jgi:hypothetical protein